MIHSPALVRLGQCYGDYDINEDPYVLELKQLSNNEAQGELKKVLLKRNTKCIKQLKMLLQRSEEVQTQLGPAAVDWYLLNCCKNFSNMTQTEEDMFLVDWRTSEKVHLQSMLTSILDGVEDPTESLETANLSSKFVRLVQDLSTNSSHNFTCIIFVQQRATVAALSHLLSSYREMPRDCHIGGFVGASTNSSRTGNVTDLADVKAQQKSLEGFRAGKVNIIVSTDVLEEGIDVPACNLIVCFDPPLNLRAFVQRRGRARQHDSKYILFFPSGSSKIREWQAQEEVLGQIYADQERKARRALEIESEAYENQPSDRKFRIASTE